MGKLISRSAAAEIIGCSPQTITNYAEKGLLDMSCREQKGRQGYFFDEDQVRALAPKLHDVADLEAVVEKEKEALKEQIASLQKAQEDAHQEFFRITVGKKTWAHFCGLVAGAYAFVDRLTPVTKNRYEADVLSRILALQSIDDILRETKSTPYRVKAAVTSIAKRMLKVPTLTKQYEDMSHELKLVQEENARLKTALSFRARAERVTISKIEKEEVAATSQEALLSTPVESMGFSKPTLRALEKNGIKTVSDIVGMKEMAFWDLKGVGMQTVQEVTNVLRGAGLDFKN